MEPFNLDISLDYGEEDFDFGSQLSSASSTRSFSTTPSCAPITPHSGRSTPQQHKTSTGFGPVRENGPTTTPTSSSMDDYLITEVKAEILAWEAYPPTPSKYPTDSPYNMDIEHATVMHSSLPQYGNAMDFNNHNMLEQYPFSDNLTSPFNVPPPPYSLHNPTWDNSSLWTNPSENSLGFLDKPDSPALVPVLSDVSLQDRSIRRPPPYLSNTMRRHLPMENAQRKSSVLHRVQNGEVSRRGKFQPGFIASIPSAQHRCQMPECALKDAGKKGYKRAEHLKRHFRSKHSHGEDDEICKFCGHNFSTRKDNYKSHLYLHTKHERSSTSRTLYHPDAVLEYAEIMSQTKRRNTAKKNTK
ncbi:hypothetical protein BKA67DRAFT_532127 [Truncatella angustata]|uniref:C2H2-type domain-containing protein n=1 Tax=Truncatella angustata TaxID=152316 RepID=A0A9P9A045_9PEZI|nr:uncharacterized protein BKA67DRAFT_532127 [Truncatella angustata]KAH6656883.1 hypothetical protein BKA67DRAFT_532127 [Truncatella angustata]